MLKLEQKHIIDKFQLSEIFYSGCKQTSQLGLELEKIAVYKGNFNAVSYKDITKVINEFEKQGWKKVIENGELIGLTGEIGHISLEPGSQFELSLNPLNNVHQINMGLKEYYKQIKNASSEIDIDWIDYGIQPVSTYNDIRIIPKSRYEKMTQYLPHKGSLPFVMMRETAGIQVSLDYKNEEDASKKMSLALKLSPIVSAMYCNSPVRGGNLTEYKSFRANSWLHTDNDRCGLVSEKLFCKNIEFTFMDYVEILLDVPMIFIERNGKTIFVKDLTFRNFMKNGYEELRANLDDWNTHISLYFPDVRFKNYIEIRNHDTQNKELTLSIPALWKGIMNTNDSMTAAKELLKHFEYEDYQNIRNNAPRYGIDYSIKNIELSTITKELTNIAYYSLSADKTGEECYLEALLALTEDKMTPADIIIKNWNTVWNKDITKLIDFCKTK